MRRLNLSSRNTLKSARAYFFLNSKHDTDLAVLHMQRTGNYSFKKIVHLEDFVLGTWCCPFTGKKL